MYSYMQDVYVAQLADMVDHTVSVMTSYEHPTWETRKDEVMIRKISQEDKHWAGPWQLF